MVWCSRCHKVGLTSAGLLCPLSPSLECVNVGVVGWCFDVVWSCPQGYLVLGLPRSCSQSPLPPMFYLGPLDMSYRVTCRWLLLVPGLEGPRKGQAASQSWLALVSGLGPLSEMYGEHRGQMLLIRESVGKSEASAKKGHLYEKATRNSFSGPTIWVGWGLRGSPGQGNSVSQVDKVSDMAPACWLCGAGLRKEQWLLPALLLGRKLLLQPSS